jgi:hypothetical protein
MTDNLEKSAFSQNFVPEWRDLTKLTFTPKVLDSSLITVDVEPSESKLIRKGQLVICEKDNSKINGFVKDVTDENVVAITTLENAQGVKNVYWRKWWSLSLKYYYLLDNTPLQVSNDDEASVIIPVRAKVDERLTVRWSLFYKEDKNSEEKKVVIGVDWEKAGYCTAYFSNYLWKSGTYRLKAKRLNNSLTGILAENEKSFRIESLSERLSLPLYSTVNLQ